MSDTFFVSVQ